MTSSGASVVQNSVTCVFSVTSVSSSSVTGVNPETVDSVTPETVVSPLSVVPDSVVSFSFSSF